MSSASTGRTLALYHYGLRTALACIAISAVAGWFVARVPIIYVLLLPVAVAAVASAFYFWRAALVTGLLIVLVEGFARNLIDSPSVLLIKDVLFAIVYVRVFGRRVLRGLPITVNETFVTLPLVLFSAIVLLQCLNPNV